LALGVAARHDPDPVSHEKIDDFPDEAVIVRFPGEEGRSGGRDYRRPVNFSGVHRGRPGKKRKIRMFQFRETLDKTAHRSSIDFPCSGRLTSHRYFSFDAWPKITFWV
jgi:hypothetical protein